MPSLPRIRSLTTILSLALLGLSGCGDTPPAFPQQDFQVIVFDRGRGLGFCPEEGMVLDAEIRRNAMARPRSRASGPTPTISTRKTASSASISVWSGSLSDRRR